MLSKLSSLNAQVVEFAEETPVEIAGTIIPAIVDESHAQQDQMVDQYYQMRFLIDDDLMNWYQGVHTWSNEVEEASRLRKECRAEEACACGHGQVHPVQRLEDIQQTGRKTHVRLDGKRQGYVGKWCYVRCSSVCEPMIVRVVKSLILCGERMSARAFR